MDIVLDTYPIRNKHIMAIENHSFMFQLPKKIFKKILLISILLFFGLGHVNAQWEYINSPREANITCLAAYGSHIFAGSYNGKIFISHDNGNSWEERTLETSIIIVNTISVVKSTVFIGTNKGLYKTDIYGNNVHKLFVSDVNTITEKDHHIFIGGSRGLYISTDDGNSWEPDFNSSTYNKGYQTGLPYAAIQHIISDDSLVVVY